ncbi:DUF2231 domain-containing protein [Hydrogenimonas thermophila]|uniref:Uncharacterized membrane protein n=1 Tax=Hydrogenimonas thermophila TaxID=223786 RepID=A0A1I5LWR6_9BACT|nr:DUF2231 domain-containing protein [Hydrogenimonas thermophila]SFP01680.1 Uncharacterized membrane protein [Hydrogenimonas thermophila]
MNLPVIDIPVHLPFDVPLLIHPIFVHFAMAIPVIVLLIELVNIKAKKPAVSITSLFLLTLLMVVYLGAFFTGKADGSEAFSLLGSEAKEELKEHKLLGTYMVYATSVLFLFKILAMLVKQNWSRNLFLVLLVLFIATAFKQGKDGGELVYEYGVNVKAVNELQDRVDDMQYDIDDLKAELKKAKESSSVQSADATQSESTKVEESATEDKTEHETTAPENSTDATPAVKEDATAAGESKEAEPVAHEAVPATTETAPTMEHHAPAPTEHHTPAPAGHDHAPAHESAPENTTPVHIPTH